MGVPVLIASVTLPSEAAGANTQDLALVIEVRAQ
jgi:hypothetical protein